MLTSILIGVLSSIVAALIYSMTLYMISKPFRKWLFIYTNRSLNTGITYVYSTQSEAVDDIRESFTSSQKVRVLTLRGRSFLGDSEELNFMIKELGDTQQLTFILADPDPSYDTNYALLRAKELSVIDGQPPQSFLAEIRVSIEKLTTLHKDNIEIYLHNSPPVYRLILLDYELYLSFYTVMRRTRKTRTYRIPSGSELYRSFERYFNLVQGTSRGV